MGAGAAGLLLPLGIPTARAESPSVLGSYAFVGGSKQREAIETAIEESVLALNAAIRGIARRRLLRSNKAPAHLLISRSGVDVTVTLAGIRKVTAPADGSAVDFKTKFGDKARLSHHLDGLRLVQTFVGAGTRVNTFTVQPADEGPDRMTMRVKITSSRLPVPVKYRLSFKRLS